MPSDDELVENILDLKDNIEKWKTQKTLLEGKLEQELENLESDFSVDSLKDAQALLAKLQKREAKLQKQLKKGFTDLLDEFNLTDEGELRDGSDES